MNKLRMLTGKTHSQTHSFQYEDFASLAERADNVLFVSGNTLKEAKSNAPICAPHNCSVKTKAEVLEHNNFTMLWIDVDSGNHTKAWLIGRLAALGIESYVIYATASSAPDNLRWRILIKIRQAIEFEHWYTLQSYLAHRLDGDDSATRAQQILYLPFKWSGTQHYEAYALTGAAVDIEASKLVLDALRWREEEDAKAEQEIAAKPLAPRNPNHASGVASGIIELYNSLFTVRELLESRGYKRVGKRYIHPNSTSGVAGIVVLNNKYYSHHSQETDALADGFAHDAFDLFTYFEHSGDFSAAIKDAANRYDEQGQKQRQREYWQKQQFDSIAAPNSEQPTSETPRGLPPIEFWRDPVDLFQETPVPQFPLESMLSIVSDYALALSKTTGFDAGGYAFCAIAAASGHINLSTKMAINSSWSTSANLWVGLGGASGAGKDPIMDAMMSPVVKLDGERQQRAKVALAKWAKASKAALKNGEAPPPKPPWEQRIVRDVTTESLANLLVDNNGVTVFYPEITEFIGRMDAYSGSNGSGSKDRGAWLRFRDGGMHTVNRRNQDTPLVIDNYGGAILAGMQPEKLAELMGKRGGGSSDGLFQRFLIYMLQPSKQANLFAEVDPVFKERYQQLFDVIEKWNQSPFIKPQIKLSHEALEAFQSYMNNMRILANRTPQGRFSEHLSKYAGFLLNLTLTLHFMECAELQVKAENEALAKSLPDSLEQGCSPSAPSDTVTIQTFGRALSIMRVLYRHSEAAYAFIDDTKPIVKKLVIAAAESVLSKELTTVKMGDLTRYATGWRNADYREKQEAIDLLIEFDWFADMTPQQQSRGRRPQGLFAVNPKALANFAHHADRITTERAERYKAIQSTAAARRQEAEQ